MYIDSGFYKLQWSTCSRFYVGQTIIQIARNNSYPRNNNTGKYEFVTQTTVYESPVLQYMNSKVAVGPKMAAMLPTPRGWPK
jgi:hypothetical protein